MREFFNPFGGAEREGIKSFCHVLNEIPLTVLESTGGTWGKTKSDVVKMILYGPLDILFLSSRFLQ